MKHVSRLTLLTALIGMTTLSASCSFVPEYYRPEAPVPKVWSETYAPKTDMKVDEAPAEKKSEKTVAEKLTAPLKTEKKAPQEVEEKAEAINDIQTIEPMTAHIKWQDFFKSKTMQDVIATALEHNKDLRIAALNV